MPPPQARGSHSDVFLGKRESFTRYSYVQTKYILSKNTANVNMADEKSKRGHRCSVPGTRGKVSAAVGILTVDSRFD